MKKISASFLSSMDVERDLTILNETDVDFIHVDVMDGKFVHNKTMPFRKMKNIYKFTSKRLDVHLMVEKPENSIESYIEAGADLVTFHIEATAHADRCVQLIHEKGKKAGIAICPATPVSAIRQLLPFVDLVLVMTVNPGWGGQKLIPYTLKKVRELADIQKEMGYEFLISVDGGVNQETLKDVVEAGTDIVVSGSSFFRGNLEWN